MENINSFLCYLHHPYNGQNAHFCLTMAVLACLLTLMVYMEYVGKSTDFQYILFIIGSTLAKGKRGYITTVYWNQSRIDCN